MYQIFVWRILQPYPLLWLFMGLALLNLWRKRKESRRRLLFVAVPYLVLTLLSLPAVGDLLVWSLERQYSPLTQRPADAQAIVVLASYVYLPAATGDLAELDESTCNRCRKAADIYRQGNPCPVLLSGANSDPESAKLAETMRDFLLQMGVRAEDLIVENQSLTTYENAVQSRKLLEQRHLNRIILITDATHLRRAVGCFRKQGVDVVPCGCQYRAHELEFAFSEFLPQPIIAEKCQRVCHEWLGLAWYWFRGRI